MQTEAILQGLVTQIAELTTRIEKLEGKGHNLTLEAEIAGSPVLQAEEVYRAYPRKVGRPDAIKAISKAIKKHGFENVLSITQDYAVSRIGRDEKFTPHPATWFNQERYLDDPSTWTPNESPNQRNRFMGTKADAAEDAKYTDIPV